MSMLRNRTILAVDDEEMNLLILVKNAREAGYAVQSFATGEEAWDHLLKYPDDIDIALLDKMMPGLNGIELLKRMKNTDSLKHIPVIIQTGDVGIQQMCEGLEHGAYYYLTKPYHPEVLKAILHAAEHECRVREELITQKANTHGQLASLIHEGEFVFRTHAEGRLLASALSQGSARPDSVERGLMELFANAIEHGNLDIGYESKRKWLQEGRWTEEVAKRAMDPAFSQRAVFVKVEKILSVMHVTVRDEGRGFDWNQYLSSEAAGDALNRPNGRGILIAMGILDDVRFGKAGNEVHCNIAIPAQYAAGQEIPVSVEASAYKAN